MRLIVDTVSFTLSHALFYLLPSIRIPPVDELIEQKSPCVQTPTAKKKRQKKLKGSWSRNHLIFISVTYCVLGSH